MNYSQLAKKHIRISWYNRESNNARGIDANNVYVKKIDKSVTHKEFHDFFSQFGTVMSAMLAEDDEGETKGYGFCLYDSAEGAKKAIEKANGYELKGKKLVVCQFEKGRKKQPVKYNNVYVKNIPKDWSEAKIKTYFEKYGKISSMIIREPEEARLNAKLPEEKKKQIMSHKYAFVCFESLDGPAVNAVNQVPYYKIDDDAFNAKMDKLAGIIKKDMEKIGIEEGNIYKFAAYLDEKGVADDMLKDPSGLKTHYEEFYKLIKENDEIYILKDKTNRLGCCQALKKAERAKKLKQLYERIKQKIKEKYKFCNLYVKNLPDEYTDAALRDLFAKFGEIRSAKVAKKEMQSSYLGIKRSEKVFGFVCFFDREKAKEAKQKLNQITIAPNGPKLYVDYHQTKQERQEFLKLKLIKDSEKNKQRTIMQQPQGAFRGPPAGFPYNPEMLRRFPPQTQYAPPPMMPVMMPQMMPQPQPPRNPQSANTRNDYYGEQLFQKISKTPEFQEYTNYFSKIVGIFLDLSDQVLERLISDDNYFNQQVRETIHLLNEKGEQ
ncbi:MAG: hypothetical protein MJ252_19440 [archaeon]|nr:hypothetical protein [archaeon]